ncbi:MAG: IPT/TIG domain-containing protein [Myxococcota bacterium]
MALILLLGDSGAAAAKPKGNSCRLPARFVIDGDPLFRQRTESPDELNFGTSLMTIKSGCTPARFTRRTQAGVTSLTANLKSCAEDMLPRRIRLTLAPTTCDSLTGQLEVNTSKGVWTATRAFDATVTAKISELSPSIGTSGTVIEIRGSGFSSSSKVVIAGLEAPLISSAPNMLRVAVPFSINRNIPAALRRGSVIVQVDGGVPAMFDIQNLPAATAPPGSVAAAVISNLQAELESRVPDTLDALDRAVATAPTPEAAAFLARASEFISDSATALQAMDQPQLDIPPVVLGLIDQHLLQSGFSNEGAIADSQARTSQLVNPQAAVASGLAGDLWLAERGTFEGTNLLSDSALGLSQICLLLLAPPFTAAGAACERYAFTLSLTDFVNQINVSLERGRIVGIRIGPQPLSIDSPELTAIRVNDTDLPGPLSAAIITAKGLDLPRLTRTVLDGLVVIANAWKVLRLFPGLSRYDAVFEWVGRIETILAKDLSMNQLTAEWDRQALPITFGRLSPELTSLSSGPTCAETLSYLSYPITDGLFRYRDTFRRPPQKQVSVCTFHLSDSLYVLANERDFGANVEISIEPRQKFWSGRYQITECYAPDLYGSGGCTFVVHGRSAYSIGRLYFKEGASQRNNVRRDFVVGGGSAQFACDAETTDSSIFVTVGSSFDYRVPGWLDPDRTNESVRSSSVRFLVTAAAPGSVSGTFSGVFYYRADKTPENIYDYNDPSTFERRQGTVSGRWEATPLRGAFPKCEVSERADYCVDISYLGNPDYPSGFEEGGPDHGMTCDFKPAALYGSADLNFFTPYLYPPRPGEWTADPAP